MGNVIIGRVFPIMMPHVLGMNTWGIIMAHIWASLLSWPMHGPWRLLHCLSESRENLDLTPRHKRQHVQLTLHKRSGHVRSLKPKTVANIACIKARSSCLKKKKSSSYFRPLNSHTLPKDTCIPCISFGLEDWDFQFDERRTASVKTLVVTSFSITNVHQKTQSTSKKKLR